MKRILLRAAAKIKEERRATIPRPRHTATLRSPFRSDRRDYTLPKGSFVGISQGRKMIISHRKHFVKFKPWKTGADEELKEGLCHCFGVNLSRNVNGNLRRAR